MFTLTLVLLASIGARSARVWRANSPATLLDALSKYSGSDTVELEPGEYVLRGRTPGEPVLHLDKPITIKSRDARQRAVLRGDSAALLIAITSPSVALVDLVIGKQMSGGDERTIDVYIAAGTQSEPASHSLSYNRGPMPQSLPSRGDILSARALQTRKRGVAPPSGLPTLSHLAAHSIDFLSDAAFRTDTASGDDTYRALHDIRLERVDFTRSLAGTNVAFARGSYADVAVRGCAFGRETAPYINALVAVRDAQFVELAVHGNVFFGDAHVLIGSATVAASSIGLNYWSKGGAAAQVFISNQRTVRETYCLDVECAQLGPVIDAAKPLSVYATLGEAFAAGVRSVRITDDVELDSIAVLRSADTTIDGGAECGRTPKLTIRNGGAIVVAGAAALSAVRNLRIELVGENSAAFVFTDGSAQRLVVGKALQPLLTAVSAVPPRESSESVTVFDGVSVIGDQSAEQTVLLLNVAGVRVELQDVFVMHVANGAVAHRGALVVVDSTFVGAARSAVYAETTTHQAALRVSGSTFVRCGVAVELGSGGASSALQEFSVQCSQFLFNARRMPIVAHDCSKKPALCAEKIRYNTVLSDHEQQSTLDEAEARMLRLGFNHVEHGKALERYVYAGEPRHFSLADDQGRLSWVSGALVDTEATFLVASYVPLPAQCLAASESAEVASAQAGIVSDVLELRSDSLLHQCSGVGVRFRIDDERTLPASLAIFGVARIGTSQVQWTRALASVQRDNGAVTLEATLSTHNAAQRHQHRIVVVALELLPEVISEALDNNAALVAEVPRAFGRRLCVVCGTQQLPPRTLDQFCGGTTDNVRTSFDDAYDELQFGAGNGAPRHDSVALYVFGTCTVARHCTFVLDQNEHLEGESPTARGTLVRGPHCAEQRHTPFVSFAPRASKASLRFIALRTAAAECAIEVQASSAQPGPAISFSTIDGGLCVFGRSGGKYVNNDLAAGMAVQFSADAHTSPVAGAEPTLIEANLFAGGDLRVLGGGGNDEEVRVTRNHFAQAKRGISLHGARVALHVVNNDGLAVLVSRDSQPSAKISAIENQFAAANVDIQLRGADTLNGGVTPASIGGSGSTIRLSEAARVTNVRIAAGARVLHAPNAASVLRNVYFDDIGASLNPDRACALELSATGIDVARSLIFTSADKTPILLAQEARAIAADPSAYWRRDDGKLTHCANAVPFVRSSGKCGCPEQVQARAHKEAAAVVTEQKAVKNARVQQEDGNTSVFVIVLAVVGVILIICIIALCIFALSRSATAVAANRTTLSLASRAHAQPAAAAPATNVMETTSANPALAALRVRKPTNANE